MLFEGFGQKAKRHQLVTAIEVAVLSKERLACRMAAVLSIKDAAQKARLSTWGGLQESA